MRNKRWMAGISLAAVGAAAMLVAPSLRAQDSALSRVNSRISGDPAAAVGFFTPAAADAKLAAVLARSEPQRGSYRFTPSESRPGSTRAVTVAVRAISSRGVRGAERGSISSTPSISVVPITYNLGTSVGWKRFAVSGDLAKTDIAGLPAASDRPLTYSGKRSGSSNRLRGTGERAQGPATALIGDNASSSIDVGGSLSLTRNLDLTAGMRYKTDRDRLPRFSDDRQDSQAVYVGTAIRF
ncbi:hypothetical protein ACFQ1E_02400 [Sphingomonas canadensis]|uniref:Porin domain-containing protein n=1 Tax=Sphingomonas canadensis TaxID=1219257 RepID=A0ABW3H2V2_9SPHN|nr:hypothetical protein [Sphingomonas canadensis]MCW3834908.1 hypothetical protein [Sphingomonas canadensis]